MDLDTHVNSIVQTIIEDITTKVQTQVADIIQQKVAEIVNNLDATSVLADQLSKKLDARISQLPIDAKSIESQLLSRLDVTSLKIATVVQEKAVLSVNETVKAQVGKVDFREMCQAALINVINGQTFTYPAGSIPGTAIDTTTLHLSGDNINAGIIKNFGSTGIDDKATACQLSIFDDTTVVENNLLTKDLTVKGTINVEGDLNITGTVPETSPFFVGIVNSAANNVRASLDHTVFNAYSDLIFEKIKASGVDLSSFKLNGQLIVDGANLSSSITSSNLQKVGQLRELQVAGESLLSETLYTTKQRVGINTLEPAHALSVWDQDIEIGIGKQSNNTGVIGAPRNQTLVISSNGKNNLTLTPDGAVAVKQLNIGQISIMSSYSPPSEGMPIGSIVFNANPNIGGPMGWVSLGDSRWANFGIID